MKKLFFPIIICATALITSCNQDVLEIEQKGVVSYDSFYKTDEDAESALTACYDRFISKIGSCYNIVNCYYAMFNLPGDDVLGAGASYGDNDYIGCLSEYRFDDQNQVVSEMYTRFYHTIYGANLVIDNFSGDKANSPVKKRCVAEARVIRAWCHMMLAIGWDCPPLVDHKLAGADKPSNYEGGHKGLLEWCAKECEEAASDLNERKSPKDKDGAVVVTKGFALAVAGKARVFIEDWQGAKNDLKQVINSGKYELVPGERFHDMFHVQGDGNEEKVFELNINHNSAVSKGTERGHSTWQHASLWGWRIKHFPEWPQFMSLKGWGGGVIAGPFCREMIANDGMDSYRRKATFVTMDEFFYDIEWPSDHDGSVTTLEEKKLDKRRGISNTTIGIYGCEGFLHYKFNVTRDDLVDDNYSETNFLIMRYAEVLLLYAEACAMTGDNDGLQYLNAIQTRAGSQHISSTLTMDEVKNEKKFEMWLECCRWPDQIRWGDISTLVNQGGTVPHCVDLFFKKGSEYYNKEHKAEIFWEMPNVDRNLKYGFLPNKNEHFPYPHSETSINPNIKQNPGW